MASWDPASLAVGLTLALVVHLLVGYSAVRAGRSDARRDAHRAAATDQPTHDEEILEGELLRQGGGGEFDPRRIAHRDPPVRAEEAAHPVLGANKNQNPSPHVDAGVRRDPNALVTQRDVLGRGNQDLAERLQRLAQSEAPTFPGAPPGPGAPDGSVYGTETDPNRAGTGAGAKIRSFLQRELHFPATATAAARHPFRLRIVISDDGNSIASGRITEGSGDETVDGDLNLQLAQLAENHTAIPELTDEERLAIRGQSRQVRYVPPSE
jgi:hypothetical protein